MTGISSMIPHVVAVGLLWLTAIVIIQLAKRVVISGADTLDKEEDRRARKEKLGKIFSLVSLAATAIAVAALVVLVLFAPNPAARTSEEIGGIRGAEVDEDHVAPTRNQIEEVNRNATERKHIEKQEEATEDNTRAMQDSINMFRKAGAEDKQ